MMYSNDKKMKPILPNFFLLLVGMYRELMRSTSKPEMLTERHQFERRYKTKPTTKQYILEHKNSQKKKTTTPNDNPQFNRENGRSDERNFTFEKITNKKRNCIEREKLVSGRKKAFSHMYRKT